MPKKIIGKFFAIFGWLTNRPSYMLLVSEDKSISSQPSERFKKAWIGMLLISIAWGAGAVGVWGGLWSLGRVGGIFSVLNEPTFSLRIIPFLTASAIAVWPMQRALRAAGELMKLPPSVRSAVPVIFVVAMTFCFISIPTTFNHCEPQLPSVLSFIRPDFEPQRVLLIMPIWGGWAMLAVGQFIKPDSRTSPAITAFVRGCGPVAGTISVAIPIAATAFYFQFLNNLHMIISAVSLMSAVIGGIIISVITGGLTRNSLLATNLLTQIAFLTAYLACSAVM